jgi:hypothetical protein
MFNKANPKILGIVFAVLLGLVLITKLGGGQRGERSFKSELISFSSEDINNISITPANSDGYSLVKEEGSWKVVKGERSYPASENQVQRVIDQVAGLKVNQVVATSPDDWDQYEVTDSLATKVNVKAGNESIGLRVGKLNFDRRTRSATSYVRQTGDDNVYGVNGFLKMSFGRGADAYRKKTVVSLEDKSAVNQISFDYPSDSSFVMKRNNNRWMVEGQAVDSASAAEYLNTIQNLNGSSFADLQNPDMSNPTYKATISGEENIEVAAKKIGGAWVVHSSQNQASYFSDSKGSIRDKLFVSRDSLLQ